MIFLFADRMIRIPCNKGVFRGEKSLNYRLLEQLPVRISSIEGFPVKCLIKVPSRIRELLRFFFLPWKKRGGWTGRKLAPLVAFAKFSSHSKSQG